MKTIKTILVVVTLMTFWLLLPYGTEEAEANRADVRLVSVVRQLPTILFGDGR